MEILVALFIFGQIPVTYAETTWTMYGANLENTHYQKMVGAMEDAPVVKWSYCTESWVECYGAVVADVDGVIGMEIVIGSDDSKVYCLDGATGTVKWSYTTGDEVYSSPTIADVDGNGTMEVVIGGLDYKVYCLDGTTGAMKWSYLTGSTVSSSPAVANVDGIAGMEVIIGSWDNKVYCLDGATGTIKWSYVTGDWVMSSPAVANIDGIAGMEIVIGSRDQKVHCLDGATGTIKWSYPTGDNVYSSPAVADVDGDGTMEVVVGSWDNKVYCLDGVTGNMQWSYATGSQISSSPAVADLNEDGNIEVVIGNQGNKVCCLNGATGGIKWSYLAGGKVHRGISIADLDGDVSGECKLEILVPSNTDDWLTCLNGEDGSVLWTKQLAEDIHDITIADIDMDGCTELIVGTRNWNKIWVLDDVGNNNDCICDSSNSIEENSTKAYSSIEFKTMGKGIYLFTPNAIQVDINVYDVSGKLQQTIYNGILSKGGHTFMPNIKSSGIYFITLQSHNFKKNLKLIKF